LMMALDQEFQSIANGYNSRVRHLYIQQKLLAEAIFPRHGNP